MLHSYEIIKVNLTSSSIPHQTSNIKHKQIICASVGKPYTLPDNYKKDQKTFKKHLQSSKKQYYICNRFQNNESHVPRKKVKNKFGLRVKKLLSLQSVQKRKGDQLSWFRAPRLHRGGRGFEPLIAHNKFIKIQETKNIIRAISSAGSEHLVYTEGVGGSNPSSPTKKLSKKNIKNLLVIKKEVLLLQPL